MVASFKTPCSSRKALKERTPAKTASKSLKPKTPVRTRCSCIVPACQLLTSPGAQVDRFIPSRGNLDLDIANFKLTKENEGPGQAEGCSPVRVKHLLRLQHSSLRKGVDWQNTLPQGASYKRLLAETLLEDKDPARILAFKNKASLFPIASQGQNLQDCSPASVLL